MVVGVCKLKLWLPGNRSLKGKRRAKQSLMDRAQHRFSLSIAEVAALDSRANLILGAAYVSNDQVHARRVLQRFVDWVESTGIGVLEASSIQVLRSDALDYPRHVWEDGKDDDQTESFKSS